MALVDTFIEINLVAPENFLKVKETLTRIGISSKTENKLWQSCHILHKRGKYYIVHFKELFLLDSLPTDFAESDIARRNTICNLLSEWKLITLVVPDKSKNPVLPVSYLKILPHSEKSQWQLIPKYTIGKKFPPSNPNRQNYNPDTT